MRVILIANNAPDNILDIISIENDDLVIAVDGGFDVALKQKINVNLVIGDLDSIKNSKKLKDYETIKLKSEKDETDSYVAVDYAFTHSNHVYLIGGIQGNRIEHFLANLTLFNSFPKLMILDNNSRIYLLENGKHLLQKSKFYSFFSYDEATISLIGFKYPLNNYILKRFDPLCISNEVVNKYGEIEISKGSVLVVETKK